MASRSRSAPAIRRILFAVLVLATGLIVFAVSVAVASVSCGNEPAPTAVPSTIGPTATSTPAHSNAPTPTVSDTLEPADESVPTPVTPPTPYTMPTPYPTATPHPTTTPFPTTTPTPRPTATPRPSRTPRPTPTPVPLAQYQGTEKLVAALTVYIETQTGTGSGFFFNMNAGKDNEPRDDVVITNEHVVEGHTYVKVCWAVTQRCVNGRVTDRSEDKDVAVIEHTSFSQEMSALASILTKPEWGWGGSWKAGDIVYASGYPGGNKARGRTVVSEPVVTEGIIASNRMARYRDGYFIEHGADVKSGSSGGPLMNNDGYIVGMNKGSNTEAERLEVAVPVGRILDWLESLNAPQPTATPRPVATSELTPTPVEDVKGHIGVSGLWYLAPLFDSKPCIYSFTSGPNEGIENEVWQRRQITTFDNRTVDYVNCNVQAIRTR